VPVEIPIGMEDKFEGIIDLIDQVAYYYLDNLGINVEKREIPEDLRELTTKYRWGGCLRPLPR